ncbi:MAG: bifunctional folylpolyglutamate synthase/dihydrofolate synthase [Bacteroides sp.]|nr:bifunctional folylpolyglutamate synthase/dihydrofolate synthase [Bacteroides sp.]
MYHSLPMFQRIGAAAYKPNLKNTEQMMEALNHPYRRFKTIHVAGTNGKGSCSHLLASVFQAAGYKTGLYTSPHLRDFRERIRVNGQMISQNAVVDFYERNKEMFAKVKASFFEMTVAMAFDHFAQEQVDIAVIEVGMGGRLDSTNVITPRLSLITNISFDHMQFLGDTLPKIAAEKAGIIKEGVPVVVSESQLAVHPVFSRFAKEKNAPILFADTVFSLQNVRNEGLSFSFDVLKYGQPYLSGLSCDLAGDRYETKNLIGVFAALDILKQEFDLPESAIAHGIAHAAQDTGLMGRWQCLGKNPLVFCDTGHNEAGIRLVLQQISKIDYKRLHIVWGMVKDKDISTILGLLPVSAAYYFCKAPQERALPVKDLQEAAEKHGLHGKGYDSVPLALESARKQAGKDDLIYVGGSTFVVAEICEA